MSKILFHRVRYVALIAAAMWLTGCGGTSAQTQGEKAKPADQKSPIAAKDAKDKPQVTVVPVSKDDEAAMKEQAVCPVSGDKLGSMGEPVKVMIGDKALFLCCSGCLSKVQDDPELYLNKVKK
jgi:hypothetical protein